MADLTSQVVCTSESSSVAKGQHEFHLHATGFEPKIYFFRAQGPRMRYTGLSSLLTNEHFVFKSFVGFWVVLCVNHLGLHIQTF
jgi:hypothetical protein